MAFYKYKDGAWMEPEDSVRRYEDGAWIDGDFARRYEDGAWIDVWKASIQAVFNRSTLSTSDGTIKVVSTQNGFNPYITYYQGDVMDGIGFVEYFVDGNWTDPIIEFDWAGIWYDDILNGKSWNSYKAGSISVLYGQSTSDYPSSKIVVENIRGSDENGNYTNKYETRSWNYHEGHVSTTISGTFTRLGFRIKLNSFVEAQADEGYTENANSSFGGMNDIYIVNAKVNGVYVDFPSPNL